MRRETQDEELWSSSAQTFTTFRHNLPKIHKLLRPKKPPPPRGQKQPLTSYLTDDILNKKRRGVHFFGYLDSISRPSADKAEQTEDRAVGLELQPPARLLFYALNKHLVLRTLGIRRSKRGDKYKFLHLFTENVSGRERTAFDTNPSLCLI